MRSKMLISADYCTKQAALAGSTFCFPLVVRTVTTTQQDSDIVPLHEIFLNLVARALKEKRLLSVKFSSGFEENLWWAQAWVPRNGKQRVRNRSAPANHYWLGSGPARVFEEPPGFLLDLAMAYARKSQKRRLGSSPDKAGGVSINIVSGADSALPAFGSRSTLLLPPSCSVAFASHHQRHTGSGVDECS
jgi:hypothetical protein